MSISRQQHQQQLAAAAAAKSKRAYVLVPSALLICLLLYKAWGVVLLVTCALVLVSHTCYSLLYKDCLFDPRSLLLIKYVGELIIELVVILKLLTITGWSTIKHTNQLIKRWFEQRNETWKLANREDEDTLEMNGRRSSYRLSTSGTEFTSKASPITTGSYQSFALNGSCDAARTSTPISKGVGPHWRKDIKPNGSIGIFMDSPMPKKPSSLANENRYSNITSKQDATKYSQMPSWAITSSPKIREKGHGVKTVQTVAGPLLASTRYNVDPKVYIDINSPGITSRLSKYATEANNKLTHQPQYGTGQFPRVNLNATPIPVLSPKLSRSILPVTVRVAPPESNYPSVETQNQQERLKLYSGSSLELNDPKPSTSVSQVLKEISLKRHASREDIMLDLVKKQRTERISEGQLESLEEMMQKRAREDSSLASDEDDMPTQSKMQRPLKRQKASSCHDILNSLSSSANLLSGVKRKATDTSQCNTEKHFKLANQSPSTSFSLTTSASIEESPKSKRQLNIEVPTTSNISNDATKLKQKSKHSELNSIESPKNNKTQLKKSIDSPKQLESKPVSPVIKKAEKLTDKLFMKPEPQNVDKIKNLQSDSVESKFKTNDKDEIRKEDIVNMRKNSMRQRLQSMFDAISGKTISKIDPDLVIQADELNTPSETSALTSLTSITSTTNVNTSPIATNIVPILKSDVEVKSPIKKTVTFNLPTSSAASDPQTSSTISTNANTNSKPTSTCSFNAPTTSASTGFSFSSNTTTVNTNSATTKPSTTGFTVSFHGTTTPGTTTATSPISSSASSPISNVANTSAVLSFGNANVNSSAKTSIEKPISSNLGKNSNEKKESGFTFGASASTAAPTSTTAPVAFGSSTSTLMFSAGSSSVTPTVTSRVTATTTATLEASKPVMSFSFGAGTPAATTASQSGFSFGGVGATTSAFSAPTKPASDGFAAPNNTQVSNPSAFGNSGNTTGFGAPTTKTSSPAFGNSSTSVGFGSSATTSSTFGPTASGFGSSTAPNAVPFGNANTTAPPAYGTSTTTSTIAFGNPSTTTAPTFGMSSPANPSAFGSATKPSLFGTSSTTASNLFSNSITATTASGSMFSASTTNTTSSIFGSQNKQETTGFGSVASKPNISTSTPSLFNAPTTSTSKQPTITSMFSASGGSSSSKQPTITSMFGKANSQATPTTTAPPAFGSNASSSIFSGNNNSNTSTTSPIFGGTSSASTIPNATNNSSIFGQSKAPTNSGFGSPAPTFGSAPGSSAFSAPTSNAFSVGVTNTNKLPTFDSIKPGSTPTFGAPTSNQSSAPSIFGSNTAFGSTTAPPPAYGASTGTSFGTASTTQSTASPFSVPSTTVASSASSLFANAASNATSASFSFSGNQASQQQQPTSSFSFGGSSGNSGSNVFQFGGASSAPKPASTGFNFSAPTGGPTINFSGSAQQAPAFNAPAPAGNMFSIGSGGSSTPRSRSARPTRRQR